MGVPSTPSCLFSFAPGTSYFNLKKFMNDYGAAAKYDFDNPEKWVTIPDVPLLDEHEMTDDTGKPITFVDRSALEEITNNNNRKVRETGDPATLILGHTSDDPRAPEKPAQGFVVNYKVKPFKRNPDGQVIYAIHGDYKLRPNKAHLVEEYPRRSVELWWHKKDIDPIAMLGGSSPERDLGVVLRHARMNHVSMDVGTVSRSTVTGSGSETDYSGEGVIRFSTHGNYSIETYIIDDNTPTNKYAKRRSNQSNNLNGNHMNNGHSRKKPTNKYGKANVPIPTERRPAQYAQDDEMPIGKKPTRQYPRQQPSEIPQIDEGGSGDDEMDGGDEMSVDMDDNEPERFDSGNFGNQGEDTQDYDGGDEGIPGEEGDDTDENDPVLAKVFQSKQWNEMSSGIDQIKQMLQGMMGGGEEEQGMGGIGGEEQGMEEMPPPGQPGMGQQAPPPGAEAMGEGEEEPEEDERAMHGQKPVRMGEGMSTGMPGPSNTSIPNFVKGKGSSSKMSRGNNMPKVVSNKIDNRDKKIIRDLRIQLSRMKAQADIQQLENEGVLFGPSPEIADKIKYQRLEELTLAYLHDEDSADEGEPDTYVKDKIDEMRTCYSRRRPDPVRRGTPNVASVARYSRTEPDVSGQTIPVNDSDDDFEDKLGAMGSFEGINEFATLQANGKSRQEAIKYCRKKYGIR